MARFGGGRGLARVEIRLFPLSGERGCQQRQVAFAPCPAIHGAIAPTNAARLRQQPVERSDLDAGPLENTSHGTGAGTPTPVFIGAYCRRTSGRSIQYSGCPAVKLSIATGLHRPPTLRAWTLSQ